MIAQSKYAFRNSMQAKFTVSVERKMITMPRASSAYADPLASPETMTAGRSLVGLQLEEENALAASLLVEQLVGLDRLIELPALGEQLVDVDAAVGDELRALRLADCGEGP